MNDLIKVSYAGEQPTAENYTPLWKSRLHIRIGFRECVNMDLLRERTFAQK